MVHTSQTDGFRLRRASGSYSVSMQGLPGPQNKKGPATTALCRVTGPEPFPRSGGSGFRFGKPIIFSNLLYYRTFQNKMQGIDYFLPLKITLFTNYFRKPNKINRLSVADLFDISFFIAYHNIKGKRKPNQRRVK